MDPYEHFQRTAEPEPKTDYGLYFMIFMIVFWPVSLVLGLVDFWLVKSYDLRLVNLALGGLAGWLAIVLYRRWQAQHEAAS